MHNEIKALLQSRLEDAEYWAGKNGYEQEAMREILCILRILVSHQVRPDDDYGVLSELKGWEVNEKQMD